MFNLLKSRPKLPASFERWNEVEIVVGSELLYESPSVLDVRSVKEWLDAYERWRAGYDAFTKVAGPLEASGFADDFDRRQFEYYASLLLQSGQWRAILLMLLENPPSDQVRYLTELDGYLAHLRERLVTPAAKGSAD